MAAGPGSVSVLATVGIGLACGAPVFCRVAPVPALAATLSALPLGAGAGAGVLATPVPLYALAVNRTAGLALAGSAIASLVAAGTAAAHGEPLRSVAGIALVAVTDEYRRILPDSELVTIQGAGHAISIGRPHLYTALLLAFLLDRPLPATPGTTS